MQDKREIIKVKRAELEALEEDVQRESQYNSLPAAQSAIACVTSLSNIQDFFVVRVRSVWVLPYATYEGIVREKRHGEYVLFRIDFDHVSDYSLACRYNYHHNTTLWLYCNGAPLFQLYTATKQVAESDGWPHTDHCQRILGFSDAASIAMFIGAAEVFVATFLKHSGSDFTLDSFHAAMGSLHNN